MLVVFLTLATVIPTLFPIPYLTHLPLLTVALTIVYLITRLRKANKLRFIRRRAEEDGEEIGGKEFNGLRMEYFALKEEKDKEEVKKKKEEEEDFIDKITDIIALITVGFLASLIILSITDDLSLFISKALMLTAMFGLVVVTFIALRGPFHEGERKWAKHYKNFCKSYMDDRYQDFWREKRELKRKEDHREEHKRRWVVKHGEQPSFEENRFEDRRQGVGEVWGDRRTDGRTEDRRQPDGERRIYLS